MRFVYRLWKLENGTHNRALYDYIFVFLVLYIYMCLFTHVLKLCNFGSCDSVTSSHPHTDDRPHFNNLGKTSFWVNFVRINCNFSRFPDVGYLLRLFFSGKIFGCL